MEYDRLLQEWLATWIPVSPLRNEHSVIKDVTKLWRDSFKESLIRDCLAKGLIKRTYWPLTLYGYCKLTREEDTLTKYINNDLNVTNAIYNLMGGHNHVLQ